MSGRLVTNELWAEIQGQFPACERALKGGRPPVEIRIVFTCLVSMLKTGIAWRDMSTELGACEKTVRAQLKQWNEQGQWGRIFEQLLTRLNAIGAVDLAEVLIDGGLAKAPCGGIKWSQIQRVERVAVVNSM